MASSELKTFTKLALTIALIIIVLLLISSYFLAMFLGPALLFSPEGLTASSQNRPLPILLFTIIGFYTPIALNFGLVFLFLWGVFAVCFIAAWKFRENFHVVIEKGFSRSIKKLFNNHLFAMPIITSMMLIAVIAIESFQEAHGVPTGNISLPSNRFESLFELSYAALIEEIGFRVIPIGAFLIIYVFWAGRKNAVTLSLGQRLKLFFIAPLFPDEAKKTVGVKAVSDFGIRGGISLGEWIMVFFTSIIFGLAHYVAGGGWEIGKVTSASVVGLAMGLTYLLYGVQAPILLHWFFNYYNYAYLFASELYTPVLITFVLIDFATTILGKLGWLAVIILGSYKVFRVIVKRVIRAISKEVESQVTPLPQGS
jgi:hypothetical protein